MFEHITKNAMKWALAGASLAAATGAQAANFYVPFSFQVNPGTQDQGLWLANTDHLGTPPFQLSNQNLDGPVNANFAILNAWTYNATLHEATAVQPKLIVYGVGGQLFKADLVTIGPVQAFSNGSYQELCSLVALDHHPYSAAASFVQAKVEPVGSPNTCASGLGIVTWLIPANATPTTAPTLEPTNWNVLGAFTDPTTGNFIRWIVWTGNEVSAFSANFVTETTLLVGPPTGPSPTATARLDGTVYLLSSGVSGTTQTDTLYRVTMTGSGTVGSFSYSTTAPCIVGAGASGSMTDAGTGLLTFVEPTNSGYAVYTTPFSGGGATLIYADSTSNECGIVGGDSPSVGYVALNEADETLGTQHVISVNEAGPATQTPVLLAPGSATVSAFVRYTINGHHWIQSEDFSGPTAFTELVMDGNGTPVQTYANARMGDDIWGGFFPNGRTPGVQRDVIYLFSPNATPCTGGTLAAINPVSFASTNIAGIPANACTALAYGWLPASVGYLSTPGGGSEPVEIDPTGGQMHLLLGPQANGLFLNLATLAGFPFY